MCISIRNDLGPTFKIVHCELCNNVGGPECLQKMKMAEPVFLVSSFFKNKNPEIQTETLKKMAAVAIIDDELLISKKLLAIRDYLRSNGIPVRYFRNIGRGQQWLSDYKQPSLSSFEYLTFDSKSVNS